MTTGYPIRAVSQLTGLGLDTLRAWERRYQAVTPTRGDRGRLYGEEDIRRLRLLRAVTDAGHAIGLVAALANADLERLLAPASNPPAPVPSAEHVPALLRLVEGYDSAALEVELGRLAVLLKTSELVHQVILPLMQAAGERWAQGKFRVTQEHLLSGSIRNLLGTLVRRQETRGSAGRILFATPEGELHEFGILAAATLAVAHHFEAVYLGPNLPIDDLSDAVSVLRPRAVVVALMEVNATAAVRSSLAALASRLAPMPGLWIGGSAAERCPDPAWKNVVLLNDLPGYERNLERLRL